MARLTEPTSEPAFEPRYLDVRDLRLFRDDFGKLHLQVGGRKYKGVRPVRLFPISAPNQEIAFQDAEGKEIGILKEMKALDADSRRCLDEELELIYFVPRVTAIKGVISRHGTTTWDLETDRGPRRIHVKDRSDIRRLPGRRVLLVDVFGLKHDIPDYTQLDERSRALLEQEM